MGDNLRRKCLKCGRSPSEDPEIKLYMFPKPGLKNSQRCELWANYCFPEGEWASIDFQRKLYEEHRMLCNHHFKVSSFTDFAENRLSRHAFPDTDHIENQQPIQIPAAQPETSHVHKNVISGPSQISRLLNITNIQKSETSSTVDNIQPDTSKTSTVSCHSQPGPSGVSIEKTKELNLKPEAAYTVDNIPLDISIKVPQPGPSGVLMEKTKRCDSKVITMVPTGCSYEGCRNTSLYYTVFCFPVEDKKRLKIWLKNCGNTSLESLPRYKLKNRVLCEDHFDATSIRTSYSGLRTQLDKDAFPHPYSVNLNQTESTINNYLPGENLEKASEKVFRKKSHETYTHELDLDENKINKNMKEETMIVDNIIDKNIIDLDINYTNIIDKNTINLDMNDDNILHNNINKMDMNEDNIIDKSKTNVDINNDSKIDHFDATSIRTSYSGLRTQLDRDAFPHPYSVNRSESTSNNDLPEQNLEKAPEKVFRKKSHDTHTHELDIDEKMINKNMVEEIVDNIDKNIIDENIYEEKIIDDNIIDLDMNDDNIIDKNTISLDMNDDNIIDDNNLDMTDDSKFDLNIYDENIIDKNCIDLDISDENIIDKNLIDLDINNDNITDHNMICENSNLRKMTENNSDCATEFKLLLKQVYRLKNALKASTDMIKKQNRQLTSFRNKIGNNKKLIDINKFRFKSDASKILTIMQFRKSLKKRNTEEEKKFCLNLYKKSPAAYTFLRKSGVILAHPSTIRNWRVAGERGTSNKIS